MGTKTRQLGNLQFEKLNTQIVEWQTVHTADGSTALTASAGEGYFIDTTSGTQTVNIPAIENSTLGDTIQLKDFARTWGTNAVTLGSNTFDGVAARTPSFSTNGQTVTLVFTGLTKGWTLINDDTTTGLGAQYISATGGTVTTSGDFKIHTFTGDGCFVVCSVGNADGSNAVDYLVVAGGGGGGGGRAGGGGAGGFRVSNSYGSSSCLMSPLSNPTGISTPAATYPITVGAGGSGQSASKGADGSNSVFSTITSAGGGGGGQDGKAGNDGGSGGGGGESSTQSNIGDGNTPPVSPPQGNPGGASTHSPPTGGPHPVSPAPYAGGGGGGAGAQGGRSSPPGDAGGPGGIGSFIIACGFAGCNGTPGPVSNTKYFAGGGGGRGCASSHPGASPTGGAGGGGAAGGNAGTAGTANTGGGGGAEGNIPNGIGAAGGKGIVIIRYKFQN